MLHTNLHVDWDEERETNKTQLIRCFLLSDFYLNMFRASLCPSSGDQDCASCWFLSLHLTFMMHGHKSLKSLCRCCCYRKDERANLGTFQQQCSLVYRSVLDNKEQMGVGVNFTSPLYYPEKKASVDVYWEVVADSVWTLKKSHLPLPGIVLGLSGLV